jgi:hypothetical protein
MQARFFVECCECGDCIDVVAAGVPEDADIDEIAIMVADRMECRECGTGTLLAHACAPARPTLH